VSEAEKPYIHLELTASIPVYALPKPDSAPGNEKLDTIDGKYKAISVVKENSLAFYEVEFKNSSGQTRRGYIDSKSNALVAYDIVPSPQTK
jgi:hypothetical protein